MRAPALPLCPAMTRFRYDIETEGLEEEALGPSKTSVKVELLDLQELGLALLELPADRFARIEMEPRLREAFQELQRLTNLSARKRQASFIGKLLRDEDSTAFRKLLSDYQHGKEQAARGFPDIAKWRDRLLADDAALTDWFARYPTGDTRTLRALIRNTRKEEAAALSESEHSGKPAGKGRYYRELFQHLRAAIEAAALPDR
ncbi:MAG: ribosome biogenesis factor YjgA [Stagnimonas sp.]|nr:ribosome biogenesis factor YjgA [Stagnimonas sp.]